MGSFPDTYNVSQHRHRCGAATPGTGYTTNRAQCLFKFGSLRGNSHQTFMLSAPQILDYSANKLDSLVLYTDIQYYAIVTFCL